MATTNPIPSPDDLIGAWRAVWIGGAGPFWFDDGADVGDPELLYDGVAAPLQAALVTDRNINIAAAPVEDYEVLRLVDAGVLVGNVVGPAASTDNAVARWDGITGKLIDNSVVIINNTGNITGIVDLTATGDLKLSTGKALIINAIQVVSDQLAAEADVTAVSAVTVTAGANTIDIAATNTTLSTMVTEINTIRTKLNNLLAKVRTHGLIA